MKYAVSIDNLEVQRSSTFQLHIPDLKLSGGDILCIAGANGSGKTTLIECLAGILQPTSGTIRIDGITLSNDIRSIKAHIGFIPDDENWFISELCATEYFELLARIYSEAGATASMPSNVIGYATSLGFTAFKTPLRMLSHGNKKKVQLIAGLMHEPSVVIVDELRNGLDPLAILAAEELILQQAARGACIIAATHDLWWAERIAQEVAFMHNGSVLIHGDTPSLLRTYGSLESMFRQKIGHA
jgi:ABC-2 type transport system ATP-binding protein